ncbi:sensor histidine kinase [Tsukamurella sp. 1534]|uniref:sensor histidine kinase n=1 Tax=Tsukamurella sp. 1534 TaxID=1151061 RepID=UPI000594ADFE|nr:histidine kinase [Tsukamurella sp. 1534]
MPSPVGRSLDWWHAKSGPEKFRLYTRLVLQSVLVAIVLSVVISGSSAFPVVGVVIAGIGALAGLEAQPELSVRATERQRHYAWWFAVACLAGVWIVSLVLARRDTVDGVDAKATAIFAVGMAAMSVLPFMRNRWWWLLATAAVTGLLLGDTRFVVVILVIGVFLMWTSQATVWSLQVLTELEDSKKVAAELEVAEERLRFSRDLHDVVGRAFAAVAVKSELAATLARAGAADRAATEMDEVKALAVTSLEDARALVRSYRDIDLRVEVEGARSLLSAAGCRLRLIGGADEVPPRFHEAAAWVVREGTTNIVKHSSATEAVLTLSPAGLVLRNDGVHRPDGEDGAPSGIEGLRGRLTATGTVLDARRTGDEFTLKATWEEQR